MRPGLRERLFGAHLPPPGLPARDAGRRAPAQHRGHSSLPARPPEVSQLGLLPRRPGPAPRPALPDRDLRGHGPAHARALPQRWPALPKRVSAGSAITDDKFLACAVEGHADTLVNTDWDVLDMPRYQSIAIAGPGQFLLALELHAMDSAAIAARFGREVLRAIQANISLEPGAAAQVEEALT